jgi:transcriptional regulator with AAA-type ATPase domain
MGNEARASSTTDERTNQERTLPSPKPYLFVVLHCDRPLAGGARYGLSDVDLVVLCRGQARKATHRLEGDLRTLELELPGSTISSTHARLVRNGEGWILMDAQSKNGSLRNGERVTSAPLCDGDFIEIGPVLLRYRAVLPTSPGTGADLDTAAQSPLALGLATLLPEFAEQLAALARIARMPVPVLLLGETGTGKEVLARAVHALSGRAGQLVAVNCGGLVASLLEGQLFGHIKGSFTGAARDEPGYIRSADGGTLFLDEIGDLPLPAQAALLRVLQESEVVPVGGTRPIKVNFRVIAATHRPLADMVRRGEFRDDLLARLSGYRHALGPLRERVEDLGLLLGDLIRRSEVLAAIDVRFSAAAGRRLLKHCWPLNIRELSQCLMVAVGLATSGFIQISHLPESILEAPAREPTAAGVDPHKPEVLRQHLVALLEKHHGRVSKVARDMGKARMQIHRWMERFNINPNDFRG